jgi:hypothetical protein
MLPMQTSRAYQTLKFVLTGAAVVLVCFSQTFWSSAGAGGPLNPPRLPTGDLIAPVALRNCNAEIAIPPVNNDQVEVAGTWGMAAAALFEAKVHDVHSDGYLKLDVFHGALRVPKFPYIAATKARVERLQCENDNLNAKLDYIMRRLSK